MLSEAKKEKLFLWVDILHRRFFGTEMNTEVRNFLGHLSWSFVGNILAGGFLMIFLIVSGRFLGPAEYAKLSIAYFIFPFIASLILQGQDVGLVRELSLKLSLEQQEKLFRFSRKILWKSISFFSFCAIGTYLLFGQVFGQRGDVVWGLFFILCVIFALRNYADAFIRAKKFFGFQSFVRFLEVSSILSISLLVYQISPTLSGAIASLSAGSLIFFLATFSKLQLGRDLSFSRENTSNQEVFLKKFLIYSRLSLLGATASIFLYAFDKLLLAQTIGFERAGIYSAYFAVTVAPAFVLQSAFVNVFFPWIAGIESNRLAIFQKINSVLRVVSIPFVLSIFVGGTTLYFLFGKQYPYSLLEMSIFSLYAFLTFVFGVKQWFLASISRSAILFSSVSAWVFATLLCAWIYLMSGTLDMKLLILGVCFIIFLLIEFTDFLIRTEGVNNKKYED